MSKTPSDPTDQSFVQRCLAVVWELLQRLITGARVMCKKSFSAKTLDKANDLKERGLAAAGVLKEKVQGALPGDMAASFAFLSQVDLLRWLRGITESTASIYDKAMDQEYILSHIGGGEHRLFDGGHDLLSAWQRVQDASPDDSFLQEVVGYTSALWKDLSTPKGLPFVTWTKDSYEGCSEWVAVHVPGATKAWFSDLVSVDSFELLSMAIGLAASLFLLGKEDLGRVSSLLGSMGISSIISANVLMGLAVVAVTIYAYVVKKQKLEAKSLAKGASLAAVSFTIFSVLGLPILIELVIVIIATKLVRDHIFDKDDFRDYLWGKLKVVGPRVKEFTARMRQQLSKEKDHVDTTKPD